MENAGYVIQRIVGLPGWAPGLSRLRSLVHGTQASVALSVFATNILARLVPTEAQSRSGVASETISL